MKIGVITDDMKTISAYFWHAQYYLVFTVENGKITDHEARAKANYSYFSEQKQDGANPGIAELDPESEEMFTTMVETIIDCDVLLARGMHKVAYDGLRIRSIQPIITVIRDIQTAVEAYLAGNIIDHPEYLC